ncbi:MAG: hypothetical protein EZS28_042117, partial [Streblomastix strix]
AQTLLKTPKCKDRNKGNLPNKWQFKQTAWRISVAQCLPKALQYATNIDTVTKSFVTSASVEGDDVDVLLPLPKTVSYPQPASKRVYNRRNISELVITEDSYLKEQQKEQMEKDTVEKSSSEENSD